MSPRVILATTLITDRPGAIVVDFGSHRVAHAGKVMILSPGPFKVLACLLTAMPNMVSKRELIDHFYGDDPNGGPEGPASVIARHLSVARPVIALCGLSCVNVTWRGWYLCERAISRQAAA